MKRFKASRDVMKSHIGGPLKLTKYSRGQTLRFISSEWTAVWSRVGMDLWRATVLGFGGCSGSFPPGLSPTPMTHVSIGPPAIPDGRISRVRF